MNIHDVMAKRVVRARPHQTVADIKEIMRKRRIHALPVVNDDDKPVGVISSTDLLDHVKDGTPISRIMSREVVVIPQYSDVSKAARTMRRRKIHHLVVTHEKQVVGIISSFDVMKLVETHRLVEKNAKKKKRTSTRKR